MPATLFQLVWWNCAGRPALYIGRRYPDLHRQIDTHGRCIGGRRQSESGRCHQAQTETIRHFALHSKDLRDSM